MDNPLFRVVGTFGDRALIEFENKVVPCLIRTKKQTVVTNDFVTIDEKSKPILATDIKKRENVFIRQNKTKQKLIAANLDHIYFVISSKPQFCAETLIGMLASAVREKIPASIILNKTDLYTETKKIKKVLSSISPFKMCFKSDKNFETAFLDDLNVKIIHSNTVSITGMNNLKKAIAHDTKSKVTSSIGFAGQSGTGKSSIINSLVPSAQIKISSISESLNTGKHTTTASKSYKIINNKKTIWLIDTPGIEQFGVNHLNSQDLLRIFPEWNLIKENFGKCKFSNCLHKTEPGCKIKHLLEELEKTNPNSTECINLRTRLKIWLKLLTTVNSRD